jgi:hypothetical protein
VAPCNSTLFSSNTVANRNKCLANDWVREASFMWPIRLEKCHPKRCFMTHDNITDIATQICCDIGYKLHGSERASCEVWVRYEMCVIIGGSDVGG